MESKTRNKKSRAVLVSVAVLGFFTALFLLSISNPSITGADIVITFDKSLKCSSLNPGYNILTEDVDSDADCFNIIGSDTTLDCEGHIISYGSLLGGGIGINISSSAGVISNVTVKNCVINSKTDSKRSQYGIHASHLRSSNFVGNKISTEGVDALGIFAADVKGTLFSGNTVGVSGLDMACGFCLTQNSSFNTIGSFSSDASGSPASSQIFIEDSSNIKISGGRLGEGRGILLAGASADVSFSEVGHSEKILIDGSASSPFSLGFVPEEEAAGYGTPEGLVKLAELIEFSGSAYIAMHYSQPVADTFGIGDENTIGLWKSEPASGWVDRGFFSGLEKDAVRNTVSVFVNLPGIQSGILGLFGAVSSISLPPGADPSFFPSDSDILEMQKHIDTRASVQDVGNITEAYEARPVRKVEISITNNWDRPVYNLEPCVDSLATSALPVYSASLLKPGAGALGVTGKKVDDSLLAPSIRGSFVIDKLDPGETFSASVDVELPLSALEILPFDIVYSTFGKEIKRDSLSANLAPKVVATAVHANEDNTFDVYAVISNPIKVPADPSAMHLIPGVFRQVVGSDITVEMSLQKAASESYRPSLRIKGLFEALFRGPRAQSSDLFGPYPLQPEERVVLAQQFSYDPSFGDVYRLSFIFRKGSEIISRQVHELDLRRASFYNADTEGRCGRILASRCDDGIKNGAETGIDCGGICGECAEEPVKKRFSLRFFLLGLVTPLFFLTLILILALRYFFWFFDWDAFYGKTVGRWWAPSSGIFEDPSAYIEHALSAGRSKEEISDSLLAHGWSEEEVRQFMEHYF